MNDLDVRIMGSLDRAGWVADWDDVLRRAGHRRPRTRTRRAAVVGVAAAAVVLVLTLPGIGVGGRLKDMLSSPPAPGIELRAGLVRADGTRVGTASLRTTRLFVVVDPRTGRTGVWTYAPRGRGKIAPAVPVRWELALDQNASSARIETASGTVVATLCAPCKDGDHGIIRARRGALGAIFGRGVVVVRTGGGTARGVLRLEKPQRPR